MNTGEQEQREAGNPDKPEKKELDIALRQVRVWRGYAERFSQKDKSKKEERFWRGEAMAYSMVEELLEQLISGEREDIIWH